MIIDKEGKYDITEELKYLDDISAPKVDAYCEMAKTVVDNIGFLKVCGRSNDTAEQFYGDLMCGEYDDHLLERFVTEDWPYIMELAKRSIRSVVDENEEIKEE